MHSCNHKHRHYVIRRQKWEKAVCARCKNAHVRQGWTLVMGFPTNADRKAEAVGVFGQMGKWLDVSRYPGVQTS